MIDIKLKKDCCGCTACEEVCPKNAIRMEADDKGFIYPQVDKSKCIDCNLCDKVCPIVNKKAEIKNNIVAYACYNRNREIKMNSSSGGVFTLIANHILDDNGVVFGVKFDEHFNAVNGYIESKEELYKFRGSKYVQSSMSDCYKIAKAKLDEGRKVLFTGTPCQIEGLNSFLRKRYENLYTQDIICHGVPSPLIWKKYLSKKSNIEGSKITNVNFRNKSISWQNFSMKIEYENGKVYDVSHSKDLYMKAFISDLILRDSCYNCNFKKMNRISDFTLADFWGIRKIFPNIECKEGMSLLILNSENSKKIFEEIKEDLVCYDVDVNRAIEGNQSMIKSAKENKKRENFFEEISQDKDINEIIIRYTKTSKISYIKRRTKSLLKKILKK